MNTESVTVINAIVRLVETVILLAMLFGLDWTKEQQAGVLAVVVAIGTLVQTIWARKKVVPASELRHMEMLYSSKIEAMSKGK